MTLPPPPAPAPLSPGEFAAIAGIRENVPRGTMDRLEVFADLLTRRQQSLNLVGPATLPDPWRRHFLDSFQLRPHLPPGPILDIGAGAGFPGLVLAIAGAGPVHLVERLAAKCAFLNEVIRATEANAIVHKGLIETLPPFPVAAITARAAAPLPKLLDWAEPFLTLDQHVAPICLFLKGRMAEDELTQAGKAWKMKIDRLPSVTDPEARILRLSEVHRGRVQP